MKKRSFTEIMLFLFIKISFFSFILYPLSIKNTELSFIYLITIFIFSGIYLSAVVVIPAHLFDGTKMKKEENEHDFFISQVESTSNYSTNIILNELFFGLNYQLEHHLFPQIHYYYYPKINHIVKKHIEKNGLIYHEHKTFFQAIMSHIRFLKKMGN
jgi:linoleoyl-CoA desaturase